MLEISLKADYDAIYRRLNTIQQKQLPYAFQLTLNDIIFEARKQIVETTYPRSFDVRNRSFARATFRVKKASKRYLVAELYDHLDRANLRLHATGGTKKPRGSSIAVPSDIMKAKRRAKGIPKGQRPRQILEQPGAFIAVMKGGKKGIWKRRGKKRLPIDLLYSFQTSAEIKEAFPFYKHAESIVRKRFNDRFNANLRRALASAR